MDLLIPMPAVAAVIVAVFVLLAVIAVDDLRFAYGREAA